MASGDIVEDSGLNFKCLTDFLQGHIIQGNLYRTYDLDHIESKSVFSNLPLYWLKLTNPMFILYFRDLLSSLKMENVAGSSGDDIAVEYMGINFNCIYCHLCS